MEQGLGVSNFLGHSRIERDYFLLLVEYSRAGSQELKSVFTQQIDLMRTASQTLKNRVKHQKLTDEARATFYSHWYYSAIRLGISIPGNNQISAISNYLNLDRILVAKVLEFLLESGLVTEKKGQLEMGPQVTHVGHDSPFVNRHHLNWRLQGIRAIEKIITKQLILH